MEDIFYGIIIGQDEISNDKDGYYFNKTIIIDGNEIIFNNEVDYLSFMKDYLESPYLYEEFMDNTNNLVSDFEKEPEPKVKRLHKNNMYY